MYYLPPVGVNVNSVAVKLCCNVTIVLYNVNVYYQPQVGVNVNSVTVK